MGYHGNFPNPQMYNYDLAEPRDTPKWSFCDRKGASCLLKHHSATPLPPPVPPVPLRTILAQTVLLPSSPPPRHPSFAFTGLTTSSLASGLQPPPSPPPGSQPPPAVGLADNLLYDVYKYVFAPQDRGDGGVVDDGECCKLLMGAIHIADRVVTVSPSYKEEVLICSSPISCRSSLTPR